MLPVQPWSRSMVRGLGLVSLLGLLACGPGDEGLVVPPMTPGLGGVRPSPLALVATPDPCASSLSVREVARAGREQGAYAERLVPAEWAAADERAITEGFRALERQPDWPCVRLRVPEAAAIYLALREAPRLMPPRATPTLPPRP